MKLTFRIMRTSLCMLMKALHNEDFLSDHLISMSINTNQDMFNYDVEIESEFPKFLEHVLEVLESEKRMLES